MTSAGDKNRIAAALDYLRAHDQFFEFDDQERVVHVGIDVAKGTDEIAAHVGNLRDLEKLTFYESDLTDKGFSHLAGLVRLKELSVYGVKVTSKGVAHLSAMSQLEDLYIENASDLDFAGFTHIARLKRLSRLSLDGGNFCEADLEPLAGLCNLEELLLSDCNSVHGTFCRYLLDLPLLRRLVLSNGVSDAGLTHVGKLRELVELYVTGPYTDAGLRQISGLKHLIALQSLETLAIHSEYVTAEGIAVVAELPKLESLYLDTPRLTDDAIAALLRCSALEEMRFTRSALSDAGLEQLRDGLPKCGVHDIERDQRQPQAEDDQDADRPRLDSSTPFEILLAKASDFDLVNGTFVKIGARYSHWVDASQYTPEEGVIMLVWHSGGLIGNGGFEYLFAGEFPGDPEFRITAEAYRIAGIERSYEAFQAAFRLFPGGVVPRDPEERSRMYEAANKSAREGLNRKVWHDDRAIVNKLAEFIRRNAVRLGDLDAV